MLYEAEYDLKEILYVPTEPHLWYLYAMIPIYMVLPFFQVMCKGMSGKLERALLVVCSASVVFNYVVSLQNGEAYYDLPLIGDKVYMLYIFIGYFIYKYRRYIRISQKWAAAIFIGCMTGVFALTVFITQRSGEHYERVLEYGCPLIVLAGAAFFMILIRWQDCEIRLKERTRRLLDIGCGCSFGIYLIHILFLDGYKICRTGCCICVDCSAGPDCRNRRSILSVYYASSKKPYRTGDYVIQGM